MISTLTITIDIMITHVGLDAKEMTIHTNLTQLHSSLGSKYYNKEILYYIILHCIDLPEHIYLLYIKI